jgi:hypothetical protein
MGQQIRSAKERALPAILTEIRSLIEVSRHQAAITGNLPLVNLCWNIGRIITRCLTNLIKTQFARRWLANYRRIKFSDQCLENPPALQFCRQCLQNLQSAT